MKNLTTELQNELKALQKDYLCRTKEYNEVLGRNFNLLEENYQLKDTIAKLRNELEALA